MRFLPTKIVWGVLIGFTWLDLLPYAEFRITNFGMTYNVRRLQFSWLKLYIAFYFRVRK